MNVKFTPGDIIGENKGTNKIFERDGILTACDITGLFPEF